MSGKSTGPHDGLLDPRSTGFGLYLGPKDPNNPTGTYFWQVWMGDGTQLSPVAVADNAAAPVDAQCCDTSKTQTNSRLTYLGLTFSGNNGGADNLQLFLYRPDTGQQLTLDCVRALHGTVTTFMPNVGGDFFIGTGSNLFPNAAAPPSFVQVTSATLQTTIQTVPVAYPGAQTAGNLNIVVVGWYDTAATVLTVTDSAGNDYALAIGPTDGNGLRQSIYFAANIKGGGNTVTVTFDQAAKKPDIRILEYAGVVGEGALDQTAGNQGGGLTSQCGPVTTTAASELIFAANTVANGTQNHGSGFTSKIITAGNKNLAEDEVASSIGSFGATAALQLGVNNNWVMQMVTLRAGPSQRLYPFKGRNSRGGALRRRSVRRRP